MSEVLMNAMWRHSDGVAVVDSGDRVAILDLTHPARPPAVLTGAAVTIWQALEQPGSINELTAELATAYDRPVAEIAASINTCVDSLAQLGLLVDFTTA